MAREPRKNSREPTKKTITISSDEVARERDEAFEELNNELALVRLNGKVRFAYNRDREFRLYSKQDIATIMANRWVPTAKGGRMPAFEFWLSAPDRREYSRITFEPDLEKAKRDKAALNLFRGFGVEPEAKERGCDLFYDHLLHNVCAGDLKNYRYLLDIFASWFQRPGVKVPAPVLVGSKGSGKSIVGLVLARLIGEEYVATIHSTEQLTSRFNSAFARALLVRVEEAVYARDLKSQSTIKHLLTGEKLRIEFKGLDSVELDSKFNCIFTSNNPTVVNATGGERRYFCLMVADHQQQNGEYFGAMLAQLESGGFGALMADLLARDISRVDFYRPPTTALLSRQIADSMSGLERWWSECLAAGELTFSRAPDFAPGDLQWPEPGPDGRGLGWSVDKTLLVASAADGARDHTGRPPSPEAVGRFLAAECPNLSASRVRRAEGRVHVYNLPDLDTCREAFVAARPGLLLGDVCEAVIDTDHGEPDQLASVAGSGRRLDAWAGRIPAAQRIGGGNVVRLDRRPA